VGEGRVQAVAAVGHEVQEHDGGAAGHAGVAVDEDPLARQQAIPDEVQGRHGVLPDVVRGVVQRREDGVSDAGVAVLAAGVAARVGEHFHDAADPQPRHQLRVGGGQVAADVDVGVHAVDRHRLGGGARARHVCI
jgi:hypothetical protein